MPMRIVQTLVVRDEIDIVEAQIAYHLSAGVDFVIATDHQSQDGTTEILESFVREGSLHLIREHGSVHESGWRTRMARLAATDFGADWVINTDADEFWMPRIGTLKQAFAAVPEGFGVVWALSCPFVPRPDDGTFFAERMIARVSLNAAINDPTSPYRPSAKAAHRADADVVVVHGGHSARARLPLLRNWYPADVLHFPYRTLEQYQRKNARRAHGVHSLGQYVRGLDAQVHGRLEEVYDGLVVDDSTFVRGVSAGCLVSDTRLRDALRRLGGQQETAAASAPDSRQSAPARIPPSALHGSTLFEADLVRVQRRLDGLNAQIGAAERRDWARPQRRAACAGSGSTVRRRRIIEERAL